MPYLAGLLQLCSTTATTLFYTCARQKYTYFLLQQNYYLVRTTLNLKQMKLLLDLIYITYYVHISPMLSFNSFLPSRAFMHSPEHTRPRP